MVQAERAERGEHSAGRIGHSAGYEK